MKVLVLGVTGFIGGPVAQALTREGHIVYGLVRKSSQVEQLKSDEVIPIVGDPYDSSSWISIIATIDAVIECIGGAEPWKTGPTLLKLVTNAANELRPTHVPKLTYVYTSGTIVHGNSEDLVTDSSPHATGSPLVAFRTEFERKVVESTVLNGIVIRPSLVYGRSGSTSGMFFGKVKIEEDVAHGMKKGSVQWFGKPGMRMSTIHVDDLAEMYVKVMRKAALVGGVMFDAANDMMESYDDVLQRLMVLLTGEQGTIERVEPANMFEEALMTSVLLHPYMAKTLLGWHPKKMGLGDGIGVYYEAWRVGQGDGLSTYTTAWKKPPPN